MGVEILTNATMPCAGIGKPSPDIIWQRQNGEVINMTGRFSQLPSGALRIHGNSFENNHLFSKILIKTYLRL